MRNLLCNGANNLCENYEWRYVFFFLLFSRAPPHTPHLSARHSVADFDFSRFTDTKARSTRKSSHEKNKIINRERSSLVCREFWAKHFLCFFFSVCQPQTVEFSMRNERIHQKKSGALSEKGVAEALTRGRGGLKAMNISAAHTGPNNFTWKSSNEGKTVERESKMKYQKKSLSIVYMTHNSTLDAMYGK